MACGRQVGLGIQNEHQKQIPFKDLNNFRFCQKCRLRLRPDEFCISEGLYICRECGLNHKDIRELMTHKLITLEQCNNIDMGIPSRLNSLDMTCRLIRQMEECLKQELGIIHIQIDPNKIDDFLNEHASFMNALDTRRIDKILIYRHLLFLKQCGESLWQCKNDEAIILVGPHLANVVKQVNTIMNSTMSFTPTKNSEETRTKMTNDEGENAPSHAVHPQVTPMEEMEQSGYAYGLAAGSSNETFGDNSTHGPQTVLYSRDLNATRSILHHPTDEVHGQQYVMLTRERSATTESRTEEHINHANTGHYDGHRSGLVQHPTDDRLGRVAPQMDRQDQSSSLINLHLYN